MRAGELGATIGFRPWLSPPRSRIGSLELDCQPRGNEEQPTEGCRRAQLAGCGRGCACQDHKAVHLPQPASLSIDKCRIKKEAAWLTLAKLLASQSWGLTTGKLERSAQEAEDEFCMGNTSLQDESLNSHSGLLDDLLRIPEDIKPFEVVVETSPLGLYSISNGRLLSVQMYLAVQRQETVWVRCGTQRGHAQSGRPF